METAREAFNKGLIAVEQQNHAKAVYYFTEAIDIDPRHAQAYCRRAIIYLQDGGYDRALKDCDKSLGIDPDNAFAYYVRGSVYAVKEDDDRAIINYTKAIELNLRNAAPFSGRGHAYCNKSDYDRALKDFVQALEINPQCAYTYLGLGLVYSARQELSQALFNFNKAIDFEPGRGEFYVCRAIVYYAEADYQKAKGDMDQARKLGAKAYPNFTQMPIEGLMSTFKMTDALAGIGKGIVSWSAKWYVDEIADLTKQIENNPQEAKKNFVYQTRANVLCQAGEYDKAIEACNEIIEQIEPDSYCTHTLRGCIYNIKKEYNRAIDDFTKAAEISPTCVWAYICRGRSFDAKGEPIQAIADFTKAIEMNAGLAKQNGAYFSRAQTYCRTKNYSAALEDYAEDLAIDPIWPYGGEHKRAKTYIERGRLYETLNAYADAIEDFTQAIELYPLESSQAFLARANLYYKKGESQRALTDLQEAEKHGADVDYVTQERFQRAAKGSWLKTFLRLR
jgi:tetratricopeptide (TPR) repeat protein